MTHKEKKDQERGMGATAFADRMGRGEAIRTATKTCFLLPTVRKIIENDTEKNKDEIKQKY